MKKLSIIVVTMVLAALVGCGEPKMNKFMPATATADAVYSEKTSRYLDKAVGRPKAESIQLTFWNEPGNRDTGYMSLLINGVQKVRPIDNIGGYSRQTAGTDAFKFVYENGKWSAYISENDIETHSNHPEEFFAGVAQILRHY